MTRRSKLTPRRPEMKAMKFSMAAAALVVAVGMFSAQPVRADETRLPNSFSQSVNGAHVIQTNGYYSRGFQFGFGRNNGYSYGRSHNNGGNRYGARNNGSHGSSYGHYNGNRRHYGSYNRGYGWGGFNFGHRRH